MEVPRPAMRSGDGEVLSKSLSWAIGVEVHLTFTCFPSAHLARTIPGSRQFQGWWLGLAKGGLL